MRRSTPFLVLLPLLLAASCGPPPDSRVPVTPEFVTEGPVTEGHAEGPIRVMDPPIDNGSLAVAVSVPTIELRDARQLYCNGTCSWGGPDGCDQADADVFCKLKTRSANAYAIRYKKGARPLEEGGYACSMPNTQWGHPIGSWPAAGIREIRFQETNIRTNHGDGEVVYDVECSMGAVLAR